MKSTTIRRILKKVALTCVSIIVCLVLAEITLRVVSPVYPTGGMAQAYIYDNELGYRLRPGIHLFKTTDFQQEVQVNELGTVNFQKNFDGYQSLVFALGDSFTHGIGVPPDQSYPSQLDLLLNEDQNGFYSKKFGVVNLGTAGYGGEQSLIALRRWSSSIRTPNVILYLGCDNDLEDDHEFRSGRRHQIAVANNPYWGRWVPLVQWFNDLQIRLRWKMLSARFKELRAHSQIVPAVMAAETGASVAESETPIFERLLSDAKKYNAKLVISWSGEGPSYEYAKAWAQKNGAGFADWIPKAKSVQAAIPDLPLENQHSNRHYRGWLNHVIAAEFAREISGNK